MQQQSKRTSFRLLPLLGAMLILAGCSFGKAAIDKKAMDKVKTVAVVVYTVPKNIKYRSDPKDDAASLLAIAAAISGNQYGKGTVAATTAHKEFINTLRKQKLPFKIVAYKAMKKNAKLKRLYTKPKVQKEGNTGMLGSLFAPRSNNLDGSAPKGLNQYGLSDKWTQGKALTGKEGEKEYLQQAIKALNVDAVLVINDPGFSFSCEACIGSSGAASTGSAFIAALVGPSGNEIVRVREWFATTDAQAPMLAGIVAPNQHKRLFKEHGKRMAVVFADYLKGELKDKK